MAKDVVKEKVVEVTIQEGRLNFLKDKAEELFSEDNPVSSDFLVNILINKAILEYKLLYPFKSDKDLVNELLTLAELDSYKENTTVISTKAVETINSFKLDSEETDSVTIKRIVEENNTLRKNNSLLSSIASDLAEDGSSLDGALVKAYVKLIKLTLGSFSIEKFRLNRLKYIFNEDYEYEELLEAIYLIKDFDYAKKDVPESLLDFEAYIKANNC